MWKVFLLPTARSVPFFQICKTSLRGWKHTFYVTHHYRWNGLPTALKLRAPTLFLFAVVNVQDGMPPHCIHNPRKWMFLNMDINQYSPELILCKHRFRTPTRGHLTGKTYTHSSLLEKYQQLDRRVHCTTLRIGPWDWFCACTMPEALLHNCTSSTSKACNIST